MNHRLFWTLDHFRKVNLPVVVGSLRGTSTFSAPMGMRGVLDMPIYMPSQGWKVPIILQQFLEMVILATQHEAKVNSSWADGYVYLTVDQKPAMPGIPHRRAGFHGDGFVPDRDGIQQDITSENVKILRQMECLPAERTYICCDMLPTAFVPGPFTVPMDIAEHEALPIFDEEAKNMPVITYGEYNVLCLTPFDIHASVPNNTGDVLDRTFCKVSFSRFQFNREGNTRNIMFDYNWQMKSRDTDKRNCQYTW